MKLFLMLSCFLIHVSYVRLAVNSCPKDHYSWIYEDFCLEIVFLDKSWYDARNYCAYRGGDLVEIRTKAVQDAVVQELKTHHGGHNGFWIGATDSETEGVWKWLHKPQGMVYSNWSPGEGSTTHGFLFGGLAEDCAMIRADDGYRWHEGPCEGVISTLHYSFICQYGL